MPDWNGGISTVGSILTFLLLLLFISQGSAIDCFTCTSRNGSDSSCGDPFHPAYGHEEKDCKEGRKGRTGKFPAKYCTKIIGKSVADGTEIAFRGCAIESLESQCSEFRFEGITYKGCVMSCELDLCNTAVPSTTLTAVAALVCLILHFITYRNNFL